MEWTLTSNNDHWGVKLHAPDWLSLDCHWKLFEKTCFVSPIWERFHCFCANHFIAVVMFCREAIYKRHVKMMSTITYCNGRTSTTAAIPTTTKKNKKRHEIPADLCGCSSPLQSVQLFWRQIYWRFGETFWREIHWRFCETSSSKTDRTTYQMCYFVEDVLSTILCQWNLQSVLFSCSSEMVYFIG